MSDHRFIPIFLLVAIHLSACQSGQKKEANEELIANTTNMESRPDTIGLDYLMGKFDPGTHPMFEEIPMKFADRSGMFIRKEALQAFKNMYEDAMAQGIRLVIKSATRNFAYQKGIWERKWSGEQTLSDGTNFKKTTFSDVEKARKIMEYSAMPGASRHHWGTDIDLNNFNNEWFAEGEGKKVYDYLQANASTYGFVQVYTPKGPDRPNGYNEEKWHWTYKPVSAALTEEARTYMQNKDLTGFSGGHTASSLDVVQNYILGINADCF